MFIYYFGAMMKKVLFTILIIFLTNVALSQIKNPESITYSVYFNMHYITDAGTGKIYTSIEGDSDYQLLTEGLKSPKGIVNEYDFFLWVADVDRIVKIDIESGDILEEISIPGSSFLNDLTIDNLGNIFITDTQKGKIFKYNQYDGETEEYVTSGLPSPNGISYVDLNDELYVVTFDNNGSIYRITPEGAPELVMNTNIGQLDGIVFNNDYSKAFISSWKTNTVYEIDVNIDDNFNFSFEEPIILQSNLTSPADIFYNIYKEELAVPLMNIGDIKIIKFDPMPSLPNGLAYYPAENKLFISNIQTHKIIYTSLDNGIENVEYFEFLRSDNLITAIDIHDDIIYMAHAPLVSAYDLKTGELVLSMLTGAVDDMAAMDFSKVFALESLKRHLELNYEELDFAVSDDTNYALVTVSDENEFYIEFIDNQYYLTKYSNYSKLKAVNIPNNTYYRIRYYNEQLFLTYANGDDYGIMIYNADELSHAKTINTLEDGSFPYGIAGVGTDIYYSVPMLNQIKKLDEASSVDESNGVKLKIYPNPAGLYLMTDLQNFEYSIYSINGQKLIDDYSNSAKIDISNLESGVYLLYINKDNNNYIQKFIKK